jgi:nitrogen fixation protein NifZ
MSAAIDPRFDWGQKVLATEDLLNDGSYPEQPAGALLVRKGDTGEVVQVGKHVDSGTIVYMVEFALNKVVGCFEAELVPLEPMGAAG